MSIRSRGARVAFVAAVIFGAEVIPAVAAPRLPQDAPVPTMLPERQATDPAGPAETPPIPSPRPGIAGDADPVPPPATSAPDPEPKPSAPPPPGAKYSPDTRSGQKPAPALPAEELACRRRLEMLGSKFVSVPALSSADGCSLPYPLSLHAAAPGVAIDPPATVDCDLAETVSRFVTSSIQTLTKAAYGQGVRSVGQASAYVCRPRNGTSKLSEHAFGNALDIASLTLDDGTVLAVGATTDPKATNLLAAIRTAACGPFKTVLGPGSDADHATHLHLDLAPRRSGSAYCR